jgi:hypothetical protein
MSELEVEGGVFDSVGVAFLGEAVTRSIEARSSRRRAENRPAEADSLNICRRKLCGREHIFDFHPN